MMSKNRWFLVLGMIGLGLAAPLPGLAASHDSALGASGEVYQVKPGIYGTLFPGGHAADPNTPVVAIDVTRPNAGVQRLLIPDTLDVSLESSATLLYENDSQTLFVLWASQSGINSVLKLAGYDGTNWSAPIMVVGNPFAPKTSPQFAITRENFTDVADDGTMTAKHRTTLHLLWQEEGAIAGAFETFYTPVVFVEGVYTGVNPIYSLNDYLPDPDPSAADVQPTVMRAPTIQSGRDQRTVMVAFASPGKRQLASVEFDVLPEELSQLSEKARSHIIEIGRDLYPSNLPDLAEKARSHIIEIGVAFHPELASTLADAVRDTILANDDTAIEGIAEKARSHIIEIGAKFSGRGLNTGQTKIVQVNDPASNSSLIAPYAQTAAYLLQVRLASSRPAPRVGPGTVKLFVSEAGDDVLVSWAQVDKVLYRVSSGTSWADPLTLGFTPTVDIDKAYTILDQRVGNR